MSCFFSGPKIFVYRYRPDQGVGANGRLNLSCGLIGKTTHKYIIAFAESILVWKFNHTFQPFFCRLPLRFVASKIYQKHL